MVSMVSVGTILETLCVFQSWRTNIFTTPAGPAPVTHTAASSNKIFLLLDQQQDFIQLKTFQGWNAIVIR
jgi:hypothetical protein